MWNIMVLTFKNQQNNAEKIAASSTGMNYPSTVCPSFPISCSFCLSVSSPAFSCLAFSVAPTDCLTQWRREEGAKGGKRPRWHFKGGGISRKVNNFRPVCGHLNVLQLSISVHQRCYVTFKVHHVHILPRALPHMHAGELLKLSIAGTSGKEGRQDERLLRASQTLAPPLV